MALGHTKSNQGQKWQMVLEFCIAVNYHKDQCPGFCEKQKKAQIIVIEKMWSKLLLYACTYKANFFHFKFGPLLNQIGRAHVWTPVTL